LSEVEDVTVLFVGDDWAQDGHELGKVLDPSLVLRVFLNGGFDDLLRRLA
jgi:hypothetical protein